jgi:hypothetical protein
MKAMKPHPAAISAETQSHPPIRTAFRGTRLLVGSYLGISVLALAAIAVLRDHPAVVSSAVWIHGTIVVISALVMFTFTARASRGSSRAYLRLRLASVIMVAAIAVIIVLPGTFPLWLKIEQGVCGLILLGVVVIVNGKRMRSLFAAR